MFNFYCRKFAQVRGDFNQKNHNLVVLGLQGFTRFSKDFKVPLTTGELTTVWKKGSNNHQPHDFEQFHKAISLLGQAVNRAKQEKQTVRRKELKKELKKRKDALLASKESSAVPLSVTTTTSQQDASTGRAAVVPTKPLKLTGLEKMTDEEIQGELIFLHKEIGRLSILTED